jgi:hypothetical protein
MPTVMIIMSIIDLSCRASGYYLFSFYSEFLFQELNLMLYLLLLPTGLDNIWQTRSNHGNDSIATSSRANRWQCFLL